MHDHDYDTEPQEGDYILSPIGPLGSQLAINVQDGKHLIEVPTEDEALRFIAHHMDAEKFWPSAWFISDHGNVRLIEAGEFQEALNPQAPQG